MIPAGNLCLVGGQNAVAAHVLCVRERKGRAVEQQVITCGLCGVVVHCAVRRDVDVCSIIGVNRTAHINYCIIIVHHSTGLKIHIDNRRARLIGKDACTAGSSITAGPANAVSTFTIVYN